MRITHLLKCVCFFFVRAKRISRSKCNTIKILSVDRYREKNNDMICKDMRMSEAARDIDNQAYCRIIRVSIVRFLYRIRRAN